MSLTCGNFAGKSSYALVVLLTLATVQRAETAGVPRQGLQRHDERQGRRQAHRSKRFAPTVVMFESREVPKRTGVPRPTSQLKFWSVGQVMSQFGNEPV